VEACLPVNPARQNVEVGGLQPESSPVHETPNILPEKQTKAKKGWEVWHKW
jgi:hypothetical protein